MLRYVARRLAMALVILLGVSMALYALIRLMPGDYVTSVTAGNPKVTRESIERMRALYGLDQGLVPGYLGWLRRALDGDLGTSFVYQAPVAQVIRAKMWHSFALAALSMTLEVLIGVPLGVAAATRPHSKTDHALTLASLVGISLPAFFFAALLKRVFALELGWLPLSGMVSVRAEYTGLRLLLDKLWHLALPVTVLTLVEMGGLMRFSRAGMLEALSSDYVRTARAKGLSERTVIYRHAFRNTLIPLVTMMGGMLPALFSGALIVESVFALDGLGYTAYRCIKQGDIPFVMGFCLFLSALTLAGTLLADLMYAAVDPRVRVGGGKGHGR